MRRWTAWAKRQLIYSRADFSDWWHRKAPVPPQAERLHWIFLATLPNSGSSAFARLIETAPGVTLVNPRAEAQWLVAAMSADGRRWDPATSLDYAKVRRVWTRRALARNPQASLAFDKSPPNLVRLDELREAFGGAASTSVVAFSRHPLAICASWAKRYAPETLAREWLGCPPHQIARGDAYYRLIGELCGQRMTRLAAARNAAVLHVSYEEFCADPASVSAQLSAAFPTLGKIDVTQSISVKDYEPQKLRNMNDEQVARLSPAQRAAVLAGLEPYADSVGRLGYALETGAPVET